MTSSSDILIRPSLGRTAELGDVYDFYSDTLTKFKIFDKDIPPAAYRMHSNPSNIIELFMSSKITEKLKHFNIDGEASLSILAGLVKADGSVSYINEKKSSEKAVQCHFVQKIRTVDERVNIDHESLKGCFKSTIDELKGTHVVVEIHWGANATVTLTYSNEENKSKQEIEGNLHIVLNKMKMCKGSALGSGEFKKIANFNQEELSLKVHADVLSNAEGAPRNLEEAMELIHGMPGRVAREANKKGKQLEMVLMPISELKKHIRMSSACNKIIYFLQVAVIRNIEQIFEEIEESRELLNDLCCSLKGYSRHITSTRQESIRDFGNNFEISVGKFRLDVGEKIRAARADERKVAELEKLVMQFRENPSASKKTVETFIGKCNDIYEKINWIQALNDAGVTFIHTFAALHKMKIDHRERDLYVLYFSFEREAKTSTWSDTLYLFIDTAKEERQSKKADFVAVDKDILVGIMESEGLSEALRICKICNGNYVSKNYLGDRCKTDALHTQPIANVIKEGHNMNDMLHHAPQAVLLMENLTILAACTRDPSLVSAESPAGKFVRLRCPTSFKACLDQVASNISNAFRTADTSMNKIHLALVDLPDYFQSTLKAIANPGDTGARETMHFTLQTIEVSSKTCIKAAEQSVQAFEGVIRDIDELVESSYQVVQYREALTEGIMTLSRIKKSWDNVVVFFHSINDVVGGPLKTNLSDFIKKANSDNALTSRITQRELLLLSLKSCGLCTQISACAQIYTAISRQHILPVINGVGKNLALSPEAAKKKRLQIETRVMEAQDAVEKLVNDHIRTSKATVQAQLAEYAQRYSAALVRRN